MEIMAPHRRAQKPVLLKLIDSWRQTDLPVAGRAGLEGYSSLFLHLPYYFMGLKFCPQVYDPGNRVFLSPKGFDNLCLPHIYRQTLKMSVNLLILDLENINF